MRAMRMGWLIYGAVCATVPIVWGLAVYWVLRGRQRRRRDLPTHSRPDAPGPTAWDYRI